MQNRPARFLSLLVVTIALPSCGLLLGLDEYAPPYCKPHGEGVPPDCEPFVGGAGSGGAGGGPTACEPGTSLECYDGPAATKGVGACKAGAKTCSAEGTSDGACEGQVQPDVESCAGTEDESCDGLDCVLWTLKLSQQDDNTIAAIERDPSDGTFILVGVIREALSFPEKKVIPSGNYDGFVARVDQKGAMVWAQAIGGAGDDFTRTAAVDAQGNVFIGGSAETSFKVGRVTVPVGRFVLKLAPNGDALWVKGLSSNHEVDDMPSVSATAGGDVIVSGAFTTDLDLGDGPVSGNGFFIAKLRGSDGFGSKTGAEGFWSHYAVQDYGGYLMNRLDSAGNVYFAGKSVGAGTFAGEPLLNAGGSDWIFGKLASDGKLAWARTYGGAQNEILKSLAIDNEGNLIMAGFFSFMFDFQDFDYDPANGKALLFKWSTSNTMIWGKQYKGSDQPGLAVDAQSNVAVYGTFNETLDLGSGPIAAGASNALFLAKLTGSGDPAWVRTYPVTLSLGGVVQALALTPEGLEITATAIPATVDFGTGPLMSNGTPFDKQLILAGFGR